MQKRVTEIDGRQLNHVVFLVHDRQILISKQLFSSGNPGPFLPRNHGIRSDLL